MRKIAIIGGYGFIGKNFADYFGSSEVTIIGNNSGNHFFPEEVRSCEVKVQDTKALVEATEDSETVIWLASSLIPGMHESSLSLDFETNIKPVIGFLEQNKYGKMTKFIYISSGGTVYGDTEWSNPIEESHPKIPKSEYGLSKLITENYIQFLTQSSDFQSFILRPSNVYGKFQNLKKPQGIIGFAFKSLKNKTAIDLYDDGRVIRDFISVYDLARAVEKCIDLDFEKSATNIYNVGSGTPLSIKDVILKIGKVAGENVSTLPKSSRKFDCEYNVLNIDKIKKDLDWEPTVDMDQALQEIWEWIKETEK